MRDVKFVSYSGKWPCLCMGELVFTIDGEERTMHGLISGGNCGFNHDYTEEYVDNGPWSLGYEVDPIDDLTDEEKKELTRLVNYNVQEGCCGGCL